MSSGDPARHDYLSAGDTPYASGDRCYSGCYLCGHPRKEHRDYKQQNPSDKDRK